MSLTDDMGLDEDSEMSEVASQSIGSASETSAFVSDFETSSSDQSSLNRQYTEPGLNNNSDIQPRENNVGQCITFTTNMEYSSVEIGDLNEDRSEKSNLSQTCSSSQETLLSIKSLSPRRRPSLLRGVSQDLNGNPELEEINFTDYLETLAVTNIEDPLQNIGSIVNDDVPIKYCVRLLCRRFLLSGSKQCVISDQKVRVSLKVLALLCLTSAFNISPEISLGKVSVDDTDGMIVLLIFNDSFTVSSLFMPIQSILSYRTQWLNIIGRGFVSSAVVFCQVILKALKMVLVACSHDVQSNEDRNRIFLD